MAINEALRDELLKLEGPVFAVLDGAFFDNLPNALMRMGISYRSLFRETTDPSLQLAGPWLVDLRQSDENEHDDIPSANTETMSVANQEKTVQLRIARSAHAVLDLVGHCPGLVFWSGNETLDEGALWKHLRSLNQVRVPRDPDDEFEDISGEENGTISTGERIDTGNDYESSASGVHLDFVEEDNAGATSSTPDNILRDVAPRDGLPDDEFETVLFRHADGNVLAEVLPVLNPGQLIRFFGPADRVLFNAPDYPRSAGGTVYRATSPDDAVRPPSGPLIFSEEQIDEIERRRSTFNQRQMVEFLEDEFPDELSRMSEAERRALAFDYEQRADTLGLQSSYPRLLFAWMAFNGNSRPIETGEFAADCAASGVDPDDAMEAVFFSMIEAAERDGMR